jgi:hypothetical protein
MTHLLMFCLDVIAILVMTFGLYFPRHRRKDMIVAYLGVNVGLLAITSVLSSDGITLGIGFGLFAVLSIIRLRSAELDQPEVAYYFAALAIGLLGGLVVSPEWLTPTLIGAILAALAIGDSPRLFARYRVQTMTLDSAYTDERELIARLEALLGATVHRIKVRRLDMVEATTTVEVRYELLDAPAGTVLAVREPLIGGS